VQESACPVVAHHDTFTRFVTRCGTAAVSCGLVNIRVFRGASACHAEGRGFEPRRSRQFSRTWRAPCAAFRLLGPSRSDFCTCSVLTMRVRGLTQASLLSGRGRRG
jgi:hypothetical protein